MAQYNQQPDESHEASRHFIFNCIITKRVNNTGVFGLFDLIHMRHGDLLQSFAKIPGETWEVFINDFSKISQVNCHRVNINFLLALPTKVLKKCSKYLLTWLKIVERFMVSFNAIKTNSLFIHSKTTPPSPCITSHTSQINSCEAECRSFSFVE